jgi:hypothetical protein
MRAWLRLVLPVMVLIAAAFVQLRAADAPPATTQPSTGATGTWKWTAPGPGGDIDFILKIKHDGKIQDGKLSFKVTRDFNGNPVTTLYTATLADGELKGKSETIFAQDFEAKRDQQ